MSPVSANGTDLRLWWCQLDANRSPLGGLIPEVGRIRRRGGGATLLVGVSVDEVAFEGEMIMQRGVDRCEFLQRLHLTKPQHGPLASSEWQV